MLPQQNQFLAKFVLHLHTMQVHRDLQAAKHIFAKQNSMALKYAYIIALPWLNFQEVYGPFALSVTMIYWAFLSGLLLLAGARLSAEEHLQHAL
jgi:hypothetical protein